MVARFDPETGRCAERVGHHDGPARHLGLTPVGVRHRHASRREPRANGVEHRGVLVERHTQHRRDRLARHVVGGGPEAAGREHDVGARDRVPDDRGQVRRIVAHHGLPAHIDPGVVQAAGEKEGVGVLAKRRQQLAADGEDFRRVERAHQIRSGYRE